ncbi:MAG TPA: oligogalacturonate lyase family protein [Opitutus sp.]|nr:oligogalacturonate lyase family protein [Opitutus sp.]
MNRTNTRHTRFPTGRLHSRRAFVKGLALAPAVLAAPRWVRAATPAAPQPASHGPIGRTLDASGEIREYKDKETGARVRMLTDGGADNVHLYFTSESFVHGSDVIVFGSNRTGRFQHYRLDIGAKRLTQLTNGEDVHPTRACLGGGGRLFYFDGPSLRVLDVHTLDDRELYRTPDGFEASLPTCTAKGDFVAFAYKEQLAKSTTTNVIYSNMAETFYQHPGSVVMRIDTSNGTPMAVWGERNWISHVLIHPTDPAQILFCHEGGGLVSQRMFMVNVHDHTRKAGATPLFPMRENEFTVHEYFTRGGEVGFQYEVRRDGKMEYYDAFSRTDGTWLREFRLPGPRPGHIQSNTDNTLVVGDRGYRTPEDPDGDYYMSLMTHENGSERVRRLCRREPGDTQFSHGHPVFSLDDQWVLYNSRIGLKENIAMADVTSI